MNSEPGGDETQAEVVSCDSVPSIFLDSSQRQVTAALISQDLSLPEAPEEPAWHTPKPSCVAYSGDTGL